MSHDAIQSESYPVADGHGAVGHYSEGVRFGERARVPTAEAREARGSFEPPPSSAADRRTLECAHDDIGPAVSLYIDMWTDNRRVSSTGEESKLPHWAMNNWLTIYARCYGVNPDADFMAREAAEVLLRTCDVVDTTQLPTCASERH